MTKTELAQRDAFWNTVYAKALEDKDIVLISADMGAPSLDNIRKDLPGQFINAGIAEQNATTLAAGLALSGKKTFTYAIAPFICLRCLEQIRVQNAIMNIPITIVGVGVGFGYEDSGPTHHLIEDIAIMRAMPHVRIHTITDSVMAAYFAEKCCTKNSGIDYIRLDRLSSPVLYDLKTDFSKGFSILREGKAGYIVTAGSMVHEAIGIASKLAKKGIDLGVVDLFTIPINTDELFPVIQKAPKVISLEEHFLAGGIGSAVAEMLVDAGSQIPLKRIGLTFEKGYCYIYGGRSQIRKYYGIDPNSVMKSILDWY